MEHRLFVKKETYDLVLQQCKSTMKHHVPGLRHMKLSQDYIVWRIAKFYLHQEVED